MNGRTIFKATGLRKHFTIVPNKTADDDALSGMATAILLYLLSKPDDWETSVPDLRRRFRKDSRNHIRQGLQDLQDAGYARLEVMRGKGGRVQGRRWMISAYPFTDVPPPGTSVEPHRQTESPNFGTSVAPLQSKDLDKENTQTAHAREDDTLVVHEEPLAEPQAHEDETPCGCEDESMAEEPEALPEPEPIADPLTPCPYDPAFPCEHQQDIAEAITPMVGNYVRVKAGDVPPEVAHEWTVPEVTLLYDWLTQVKAPDEPAWWRLRNAFSPKHRDDHLCMAKEWAAKRDAKRSAAVCPHPPNRIGYNPMLAQYHCFGCFRDVPVEVAAALGCDEHLDSEPQVEETEGAQPRP